MSHDVFISFPHEHDDIMKWVKKTLAEWGVVAYVHRHHVAPGRFPKRLLDNISQSKCLVLIWTSRTRESSWCYKEVAKAIEMNLGVIPLDFDGSEPDDRFAGHLEDLEKVNYIECFDHGNEVWMLDRLRDWAGQFRTLLRETGIRLPEVWEDEFEAPKFRPPQPETPSQPPEPPEPPEPSPPEPSPPEPGPDASSPFVDVRPMLGLLESDDRTQQFCTFPVAPTGEGSAAVLSLVQGDSEGAIRRARESFAQAIGFDGLRTFLLASLGVAARTRNPETILDAGMTLAVLRHSPELWTQFHASNGQQDPLDILSSLQRALAELVDASAQGEEFALTDALDAEEEAASLLREKKGLGLVVGDGRVAALSFGYRFATQIGESLDLVGKARSKLSGDAQGSLRFSSAWWVDYLLRHDRPAEVLRRRWHRLAGKPGVAERIAEIAELELRASLDLDHLFTGDDSMERAGRASDAILALWNDHRERCPEIAERGAGILLEVAEQVRKYTVHPYMEDSLESLFQGLDAIVPDKKLLRRLRQSLAGPRARSLLESGDPEAALRAVDEARRVGVRPNEEDLVLEAEAALVWCRNGGVGALTRARMAVGNLSERAPQHPRTNKLRKGLELAEKEAELARAAGSPSSFEDARSSFDDDTMTRSEFLRAVRRQAKQLMEEGGAEAVLSFLDQLSAELPDLKELNTLHLRLGREWMNDFDADGLIELSTGRRPSRSRPVRIPPRPPKASPTPTPDNTPDPGDAHDD